MLSEMATSTATSLMTTESMGKDKNDWPLWVQITVPIISVLAFIAVQIVLFFVKDPGYHKIAHRRYLDDAEFGPSVAPNAASETAAAGMTSPPAAAETAAVAAKGGAGGGLPKSSSTTCHMVSREEVRQQRRWSRRTLSESDVEPKPCQCSSETQAYLEGVLRCNMGHRNRLASSSSTGTSDDGGHATFALSFGKKRRARSISTGEMHRPMGSPTTGHESGGSGLIDPNQLTISSIKEENEYGSRDHETKL